MDLQTKYKTLREVIWPLKRVLVAFSGGVDSTFLLKASVDVLGRDHVLACINVGRFQPSDQGGQARVIVAMMGVELMELDLGELEYPELCANHPDRCYVCKSRLFEILWKIARDRNIDSLLCGHNLDDQQDYRPGQKAVEKLDVLCPLVDAGMTKADIRELSRQFGLPTAEKPASPCLATRIPYDQTITAEKLRQIDQGELFLKEELGLADCRVRHHDELVRIEVPHEAISQLAEDAKRLRIVKQFKSLGFQYISLDLQGFRSGAMNETLSEDIRSS